MAHAQVYFYFSGGGGGAARAGSVGGEAGKMFHSPDPRYLLGGSFSVAFNGGPGTGSTPFEQVSLRNEQQLRVVAGIRLVKHVFAVAGLGGGFQDEKDVLKPPGQRSVTENVPLREYGDGSLEIRYIWKGLMAGVGYDSRRGIVAGLGFIF